MSNISDTKVSPWERTWHIGVKDTYHLEAIGQIVVCWSYVEHQMQRVFWHFARLDPVIGSIICGGMRYGDVVDAIRRIVDKTQGNQVLVDYTNELFSDLAKLKSERDKMAHHVWSSNGQSSYTMKQDKGTHSLEPTKEFSILELRSLAESFLPLIQKLHALIEGETSRERLGNSLESRAALPTPWLDKFLPRHDTARPQIGRKRKPSRQPPA